MALSRRQKSLRAETLSIAVRKLREKLDCTQPELVAFLRHKIDIGMISRWESGKHSPSPAWRQYLAAFARRRGYNDIAAAFEEPLTEWKQALLSPEDRHMLALFEIVVLNKPPAQDAWPQVLPWHTYERLQESLCDAVESLKSNQGRTFPSMRGSWSASLLTEEQVAAWFRETHPRAKKVRGGPTEGPTAGKGTIVGVVSRYVDGRVDVQTEKETPRGKAKKGTR
jgi:hypothetical protein